MHEVCAQSSTIPSAKVRVVFENLGFMPTEITQAISHDIRDEWALNSMEGLTNRVTTTTTLLELSSTLSSCINCRGAACHTAQPMKR